MRQVWHSDPRKYSFQLFQVIKSAGPGWQELPPCAGNFDSISTTEPAAIDGHRCVQRAAGNVFCNGVRGGCAGRLRLRQGGRLLQSSGTRKSWESTFDSAPLTMVRATEKSRRKRTTLRKRPSRYYPEPVINFRAGVVASGNCARRGEGRRLWRFQGENDNKVWRDLRRNPKGWDQFSSSLCRSSLADTRYASQLASRSGKNWLPALPTRKLIAGSREGRQSEYAQHTQSA